MRSLILRITLFTVVLVLAIVGLNYALFTGVFRDRVQATMVEKAAVFTANADEAKNHMARLHATGIIDKQQIQKEYDRLRSDHQPLSSSPAAGAIPIVAGWSSAMKAAKREGLDFRIPAFAARNPDNEVKAESFRGKMLTDLTATAQKGGVETLARVDRQDNTLHFMRAIRLSEDCMGCHGVATAANDPDGDGKDALGYKLEGWKVGDVHGAYEVVMPLNALDAQVASFVKDGLAWSLPLTALGLAIFIWLLRRSFGRPVRMLVARLEELAAGQGDLTTRIPIVQRDELGEVAHWVNAFLEQVHAIVVQVKRAGCAVTAQSSEITNSTARMAAGLHEQAGRLQQISAAVMEMAASVTDVAKHTGEAAEVARLSGQLAQEGGEVVGSTLDEMRRVQQTVDAGADRVVQLGAESERIGEVVEMINEIAEQTNLLALNASIEAARAGEHGRGFAIVAEEVRKLADRTTSATQQVSQRIGTIRKGTGQAVDQMHASQQQITSGVEQARGAGDKLGRIVTTATDVARMIVSIAAAAEQQSAASDEISHSVESISGITAEASAMANDMARAADSLSGHADELQQLVARFRTRE